MTQQLLMTIQTLKSSNWNFRVNDKQYSVLFPDFWRNELRNGATLLTDSGKLTLDCKPIDKMRNKWSGN